MSMWDHLLEAAILIMLGVAVSVLAFQLMQVVGATGPHCPGMDPSYLGWCEVAQ